MPTASPQPPASSPSSPSPSSPASDPQGEIAYVDGGNLWLLDLLTGQQRQLTDDGHSSDPAWSPDGQSLAFTALRDGQPQIDMLRVDSSERTQVTRGEQRASLPAWSRDGALFFVRHTLGDLPQIEIVSRADDGTESIMHTEPGGLCGEIGLSVAADRRAALALNCGRGSYTLIVTPGVSETLDVGAQIGEGLCAAPGVWAQQDSRLAVIAAPECAFQQETDIAIIDNLGAAPQVTQILRSSGISGLDWSPDGQWIVYARPDGLWLMQSDQGEPRRLITSGAQPAWRPDVRAP